jgi:hypothetical protein
MDFQKSINLELNDFVRIIWDEDVIKFAKQQLKTRKEKKPDITPSADWLRKPKLAAGQHRKKAMRLLYMIDYKDAEFKPDDEKWVPAVEMQLEKVNKNKPIFVCR